MFKSQTADCDPFNEDLTRDGAFVLPGVNLYSLWLWEPWWLGLVWSPLKRSSSVHPRWGQTLRTWCCREAGEGHQSLHSTICSSWNAVNFTTLLLFMSCKLLQVICPLVTSHSLQQVIFFVCVCISLEGLWQNPVIYSCTQSNFPMWRQLWNQA